MMAASHLPRRSRLKLIHALPIAVLFTGCASVSTPNAADPWEGFNRRTFQLNDAVDRAVVKPAATAYARVVPQFARTGIGNFFANLADVGTSLNNFLQGKGRQGLSDIGRFGINTTVGVVGLWDVATKVGLEKHREDFGQTLGWWGTPSGPYLVLPLFGPSTLRDAPAKLVDPMYFYTAGLSSGASLAYKATDTVNARANLLPAEKVLNEAAPPDRYAFVRDAWLQRRKYQVYDGAPPKENSVE